MSDPTIEKLDRAWSKTGLQRQICPGRLLYPLRSTYGTWILKSVTKEQFREALVKLSKNGHKRLDGSTRAPYFRVLPEEGNGSTIKIDFLTGRQLFLDCMTLKIKSAVDGLELSVYTLSSGMIPLRIWGSLLFSTLFALAPFTDQNNYTSRTCQWLKAAIDKELQITSALTLKRYTDFHKGLGLTPDKMSG